MNFLSKFAVSAIVIVISSGVIAQGLPVKGLRSPISSAINVMPLTAADQEIVGSGAYCTATNAQGQVLFSAADNAVVRVNGRRVLLQMGRASFSSMILLAFDKSFWVEFTPRAGRVRQGEESESKPMTMKVGHGNRFVSYPVMRECGA